MSNKVTPRTPAGFMELLPEEQIVFNHMLHTIRDTYELYGFAPIETPAVEYAEVLLAKGGGDTEKEMYRFTKGDNDLALHFDLTVPTARYAAEHFAHLTFPFRRYQIQKVWRAEKPQKGRQREFYQCDIDIIGSKSHLDDAEIPSVIYTAFRKLGFSKFMIRMNNRKLVTGFLSALGVADKSTEILRLVDKLEKKSHDELKSDMEELGVSADVVEQIFEFVLTQGAVHEILTALEAMNIADETFQEGLAEMQSVTQALESLGVPETHYRIDLMITRGLDYYTGTVYETQLTDYPQFGSVCSGGRYDNLVGYYTDEDLPGVGISIGLSRLFDQMRAEGLVKLGAQTPAQVLVVRFTDEQLPEALETAKMFRDYGISTEVYMSAEKFGKQLKYGNKKRIPYAAIIGASESGEDQILIKNMETGDQAPMDIHEAIKLIKR